MSTFFEQHEKERARLIQMRETAVSYLRRIQKGRLSAYERNGLLHYYATINGIRSYLGGSNAPLVSKLKARRFFEEVIRLIDDDIQALDRFEIDFSPITAERLTTLAQTFPKAYQNVPDACFSELGFFSPEKWKNAPFQQSTYHPERRIHHSRSGQLFRSRVEAAIADLYDELQIPFHYEEILILPDGTMIVPDFTVLSPSDGRIRYHEHVGMLTEPQYAYDFMLKLNQYRQNGLIPWQDVFFTFDSGNQVMNLQEIHSFIVNFMM